MGRTVRVGTGRKRSRRRAAMEEEGRRRYKAFCSLLLVQTKPRSAPKAVGADPLGTHPAVVPHARSVPLIAQYHTPRQNRTSHRTIGSISTAQRVAPYALANITMQLGQHRTSHTSTGRRTALCATLLAPYWASPSTRIGQ
eukprot:2017031-Rhodomonas_salina.5